MVDRASSGELFGIPYNFEPPKLTNIVKAYWQPGEGMLVSKPFGIGYTLNLANWKSWLVIGVAAGLVYFERRQSTSKPETQDQKPVEVIVDD